MASHFQDAFPRVLFYLISYIIIYCLVYSISPLGDDWYYATSPNPDFQLSELLPGQNFWRPFDVLFGAFIGLFPKLFPMFNRAVVVLAHVLNAALLDGITKKMEIKPTWRKFAVCFFLFSSAAWAVTISPDALNQAYSVLFGLLAIYLHLKNEDYQYLLWCLIALLWKESGVSWFFVIPVFDAFFYGKTWNGLRKNAKLVKRLVKQTLLSFGVVIAYFSVRFILYGGIALGSSSGTYKLDIFSFTTIKNAFLLFGSAGTGVDSIALLGHDRSLLLVGITIICSLVFIVPWLFSVAHLIAKRKQVFSILCIILCSIGLALPLMILGKAGEMHAYPVLCGVTILYSFCLDRSNACIKKHLIPIICIFLAFTISSAHKLIAVYDYSNRTQQLTKSIQVVYDDPSGSVLFVSVNDFDGYSVFSQSALFGTSRGLSMRPYWGWTDLNHTMYSVRSEEEALSYIQANHNKYNHIFMVHGESIQKMK